MHLQRPNTHAWWPPDPDAKGVYDFKTSLEATWGAMEALVDRGLVKSIGLSNFNRAQIERVLRVARIKPAVLQIESHPFFANDGNLGPDLDSDPDDIPHNPPNYRYRPHQVL